MAAVPAAGSGLINGHSYLFRQRGQLVHGGGAHQVAGHQQGAAPLVLQAQGQLRAGRGLAGAVRAEQPYDAAGGQADSKAVERHRGAIALSEVAALEQGRRRDFGDKGIHGKPPHRSESLAPS